MIFKKVVYQRQYVAHYMKRIINRTILVALA